VKPAIPPGNAPKAVLAIVCSSCLRRYQVPASAAGKSVSCKACGKAFPLRVLGQYQILNEIGSGTFGAVFRGFDTKLKRFVAIKLLHGQWSGDAQVVARFRKEAQITAQINHPNIVPLHAFGENDRETYFVSALVSGKELKSLIPPTGFEDPRQAVQIAITVLEALDHVHRTHKVLHRDIKPANIMIDERGFVYLLDFGVAACRDPDMSFKTTPGGSMGTPAYMAPEQADARTELMGPASDQYSVGVVLYHMLTGRVPFEKPYPYLLVQILEENPPRPLSFRPNLAPVLEKSVLRALAKSPERRFPTCMEFAAALREWLENSGSAAAVSGKLRWWAIGAVATAGLAALLAGGILMTRLLGPRPKPPVEFHKQDWTPKSVPSSKDPPK
jgi:serine/threonine-protein kinase